MLLRLCSAVVVFSKDTMASADVDATFGSVSVGCERETVRLRAFGII